MFPFNHYEVTRLQRVNIAHDIYIYMCVCVCALAPGNHVDISKRCFVDISKWSRVVAYPCTISREKKGGHQVGITRSTTTARSYRPFHHVLEPEEN